MACTIIATPGAANANSYCTEAEATTYNDAHVSGATWTSATSDQRCRALATATMLLDAQLQWHGEASTDTQSLAWPRIGMTDPVTGATIDSAVVPTYLKSATAEFARLLLVDDPTAKRDTELSGISLVRAGSVAVQFNDPVMAATSASRAVIPASVVAFIKSWTSGGSSLMKELVRT